MPDCCLNLSFSPHGCSSPGGGWFSGWSRERHFPVPALCARCAGMPTCADAVAASQLTLAACAMLDWCWALVYRGPSAVHQVQVPQLSGNAGWRGHVCVGASSHMLVAIHLLLHTCTRGQVHREGGIGLLVGTSGLKHSNTWLHFSEVCCQIMTVGGGGLSSAVWSVRGQYLSHCSQASALGLASKFCLPTAGRFKVAISKHNFAIFGPAATLWHSVFALAVWAPPPPSVWVS